MIKPQDILNPQVESGYDHVGDSSGETDRANGRRRWRARLYGGKIGKMGAAWTGPSRATAVEAAQDYCDHMNGNGIALPKRLNSAGHKGAPRTSIPRDDEVEAALGVLRDARAQREGVQGYVYLIGVAGDLSAVKVGYSTNPEKRAAELQTGNPHVLILMEKRTGTAADEADLHERYIEYNLIGEWFRPTKELLSEFGLTKYDLLRRCGGMLRSVA